MQRQTDDQILIDSNVRLFSCNRLLFFSTRRHKKNCISQDNIMYTDHGPMSMGPPIKHEYDNWRNANNGYLLVLS